jgi:hypothetical protein
MSWYYAVLTTCATSPWSAQVAERQGRGGGRFQRVVVDSVCGVLPMGRGRNVGTKEGAQSRLNDSANAIRARFVACVHTHIATAMRAQQLVHSLITPQRDVTMQTRAQSAENAILQRRDAGDETLTDVGQQTSRGDAASRAAIGASVQKNKCDAPWRVRMPPLGHWRPYLAVCVPPPTRMHPSEIHGLTLIKSSLKY